MLVYRSGILTVSAHLISQVFFVGSICCGSFFFNFFGENKPFPKTKNLNELHNLFE